MRQTEQEEIIARVADRNIYLDDLMDRAQLTVRPAFLKRESSNQKRLLLNSLIAEKILAIEAESKKIITDNEKLQNYVKGISEQKMRQMHFERFARDEIMVDTELVNELLQNASRQIELSYFDIAATENYDSVSAILNSDSSAFDDLCTHYYPQKKAHQQTVSWNNVLNSDLYEKLFRNDISPADVIGPEIREDGRVFFFRVDGWSNTATLSPADYQTLRRKTESKIREQQAREKYEHVIAGIMAGKKLEFSMDGLLPLIDMLGPVYLGSSQNEFLINQMERYQREVRLDTLLNNENTHGGKTVFQIDGKIWTIDNVFDEMKHHPLVFRKRRFARSQFGEHLKIALVDMMRDHYITREAYEMGYDATDEVRHTRQLWQDHFYAVLLRETWLVQNSDSTIVPMEYIDQRVRKLRSEYENEIEINEQLLGKTEIADVQMLTFQRNVPYPMVTPGFPLLTLDDN